MRRNIEVQHSHTIALEVTRRFKKKSLIFQTANEVTAATEDQWGTNPGPHLYCHRGSSVILFLTTMAQTDASVAGVRTEMLEALENSPAAKATTETS